MDNKRKINMSILTKSCSRHGGNTAADYVDVANEEDNDHDANLEVFLHSGESLEFCTQVRMRSLLDNEDNNNNDNNNIMKMMMTTTMMTMMMMVLR